MRNHHDGQDPMSMIEERNGLHGGGEPNGDGASKSSEMLSCEEALRVVQEFLDGELDITEAAGVKSHFEACVRCYPHLDFETAYRQAVCRAVRGETAPPELRARVAALIAEAEEGA
jgi:anti-sigma factor (TIGR02949 family)